MDWINFFELKNDFTLRDLKRAYAKLIKNTRPEDDPNYFMKIRSEYELGCKYFENLESNEPLMFKGEMINKNRYIGFEYEKENTIEYENAINMQGSIGFEYEYENTIESEYENTIESEYENTIDKSINMQKSIDFEYDDENSINQKINKHESINNYNKLTKNNIDIYLHIRNRLLNIYEDLDKRYDKEIWSELLNNLNLSEEVLFVKIFENFLEDHIALSKEIAELIMDILEDFSKECIEKLEFIIAFDFNYNGYSDILYDEVEGFFKIRYLIYAYFNGDYSYIDLNENELKRYRSLTVKNDLDYRIFLHYMIQNNMENMVKYYLEIYDEKQLIEKGYMAYLAQMSYDQNNEEDAYKKYRMQLDAFKDNKAYEIGTYSSGRKLVQKGEHLKLPVIGFACLFELWKKKPKFIEKMKIKGYKKSIKNQRVNREFFIFAVVIIFSCCFVMLLNPISEFLYKISSSKILRVFIVIKLFFMFLKSIIAKKRRNKNG